MTTPAVKKLLECATKTRNAHHELIAYRVGVDLGALRKDPVYDLRKWDELRQACDSLTAAIQAVEAEEAAPNWTPEQRASINRGLDDYIAGRVVDAPKEDTDAPPEEREPEEGTIVEKMTARLVKLNNDPEYLREKLALHDSTITTLIAERDALKKELADAKAITETTLSNMQATVQRARKEWYSSDIRESIIFRSNQAALAIDKTLINYFGGGPHQLALNNSDAFVLTVDLRPLCRALGGAWATLVDRVEADERERKANTKATQATRDELAVKWKQRTQPETP